MYAYYRFTEKKTLVQELGLTALSWAARTVRGSGACPPVRSMDWSISAANCKERLHRTTPWRLDALTPESSIDPVQTSIDRTSNVPPVQDRSRSLCSYAERRTRHRRGGSQQRDNADRRWVRFLFIFSIPKLIADCWLVVMAMLRLGWSFNSSIYSPHRQRRLSQNCRRRHQ
jgi:hypothetical protein